MDEVFDRPALWRAEIISGFRLRGAERCAAASPAPGFPQVLDSLLGALGEPPPGVWLDVGGGLGGVASWIERLHREKQVVVADPAFDSLRAAAHLFPSLRLVACDGRRIPVRGGSIPVVMANGVLSLVDGVDDLDVVLAEIGRILAPGGSALVTDLWSSTSETIEQEPNTFWSIEALRDRARAHGLADRHVAVAEVTAGWWSSAAMQVNEEIAERYSNCPDYHAWRRDQDHIEHVLAAGEVVAAGVVLQRPD